MLTTNPITTLWNIAERYHELSKTEERGSFAWNEMLDEYCRIIFIRKNYEYYSEDGDKYTGLKNYKWFKFEFDDIRDIIDTEQKRLVNCINSLNL